MIKDQSNKFPVMLMCRLLTVSVSGYYSWLNREPSLREKENIKLAFKIKDIFDDECQTACKTAPLRVIVYPRDN